MKASFTIGKCSAIFGAGALALSFLLCCLVGILAERGIFPEVGIRAAGVGILVLSVFLGSLFAAKLVGSRRLLVALLTAAVYLLGVLFLAMAAFPDAFPGILGSVVAAAVAAVAAGLVSSARKKRRKY